LLTPQKNLDGPGTMPLTFLRQSLVPYVPAERCEHHVVERGLVEPARDGLLFVERCRLVPGGDLVFDLRNGWPAATNRDKPYPARSRGCQIPSGTWALRAVMALTFSAGASI